MASMVYRSKVWDQIDMFLWKHQLRFARHLVGIHFQDFRSQVKVTFSIENGISRCLWTNTTPSQDCKGKKPIGSLGRLKEVNTINHQHQRPTHHSYHRSFIVRARFLIHNINSSHISFNSLSLLKNYSTMTTIFEIHCSLVTHTICSKAHETVYTIVRSIALHSTM